MSTLSPQAQAVLDAVLLRCMVLDHRSATPEGHAAAIAETALRAAAIHCGYRPPGTNDHIISDGELIAVAKELEGGHVD